MKEKLTLNENKLIPKDKAQIIEALGAGRCYVANYYHGETKGFRFYAMCNGETYTMGDEINLESVQGKKVRLEVLLPKDAKIKLVKNGKVVDEHIDMKAAWQTDEPGIYRVECWQGDKAWIFTNHIRII